MPCVLFTCSTVVPPWVSVLSDRGMSCQVCSGTGYSCSECGKNSVYRRGCLGLLPACVGSSSWNSCWQHKNHSQVERSDVFEFKILLGSPWSAPAEGRPQAGGSQCPLVPLRRGNVSACADGDLDGAERSSVECSADFPLVPPGMAAVHLCCLHHAWP